MSSPVVTQKGRKSFSLRGAIINNSPRKNKTDHKSQHNHEKQKNQKLVFNINRSFKGVNTDKEKLLSSSEQSEDWIQLEEPQQQLEVNVSSPNTVSRTENDESTIEDTTIEEPEIPLLNLEDTSQNNQDISVIQRYILKWNCETELMKRERWQIERVYIVQEILSSEETYVKILNMVITDVYDPVVESLNGNEPLLDSTVVKKLFPEGHIKIIHSAHAGVIKDLRQRITEWGPHQIIGDIFNDMCKFLRLYTKYAETLVEVEATLECIKKEKKFLQYLKDN